MASVASRPVMPGRGALDRLVDDIGVFEGALQPFGSIVLALPQDVGDLLPIAGKAQIVEAAIEVNHVALLIHQILGSRMDIRDRFAGGRLPPLHRGVDLEPGLGIHAQRSDLNHHLTSAARVTPGVMTSFESVLWAITSVASTSAR